MWGWTGRKVLVKMRVGNGIGVDEYLIVIMDAVGWFVSILSDSIIYDGAMLRIY